MVARHDYILGEPLSTLLMPIYAVLSWTLFWMTYSTGAWIVPVGCIGATWSALNNLKHNQKDVGVVTMGFAAALTAFNKYVPSWETEGLNMFFRQSVPVGATLMVVANYCLPFRQWQSFHRTRKKLGKSRFFFMVFRMYCLSSITLWLLGSFTEHRHAHQGENY